MSAPENSEPEFLRCDAEGTVFRADPAVYGEQAILEAVHRFTRRCFVLIDREPTGVFVCRVTPRVKGDVPRDLAGALANEILDQSLRQRLHAETEPIRRLLLAQAFSRTDILHPDLDESSPADDVRGIAAPDPPFRSHAGT